MPDETIDRLTIRGKVVAKLNAVLGRKGNRKPVSDDDAGEKLDLWKDLGMSKLLKQAMATPYKNISEEYNGLGVSMKDAGSCETVKDSVDLVYKRSNNKVK